MPTELLLDKELPTRSASIAETLRSAILAGDFAPGERLREVILSERLQVSRTPIRAALQALAGEGLLVHIPNRGYHVREYSVDDIVQAYEIRAALEGLTARRAAQLGMEEAERTIMERALRDGDTLFEKGSLDAEDRSTYGAINDAVHSAVHSAAKSRMLKDLLRTTHQVAPSSHRNVIAFDFNDVRRRHDDHHRIYEAILCRDGGRAEMIMRDHVESIKVQLLRHLPTPGRGR